MSLLVLSVCGVGLLQCGNLAVGPRGVLAFQSVINHHLAIKDGTHTEFAFACHCFARLCVVRLLFSIVLLVTEPAVHWDSSWPHIYFLACPGDF